MRQAESVTYDAARGGGEIVRCVGCGIRARWEDGVPVNAEPFSIPSLCPASARPRAHGPFA